MKRILFIAILSILGSIALQSCGRNDDNLNGLKPPIRVLAIANGSNTKYGSIVLIDSIGTIKTLCSVYATGNALINSYKIGDTIK